MVTEMNRCLAFFCLASFAASMAMARGQRPAGPAFVRVEEGRTVCRSGGKRISIETFIPQGPQRHPAVIVLYGSGGALFGKSEMVAFARQYAGQGAAVFLVHYFDRTGTLFVTRDGPIHRHQAVWTETVRDAVDFVTAHPRVRKGPVGLFGYSLGAYLAVSESSRDPRIGCVVELSGGIFDEVRPSLKRFPHLLILHGRLDQRVPVKRAFELEATARQFGSRPQTHIYEEEGHRLSKIALADAAERGGAFLRQHLRY